MDTSQPIDPASSLSKWVNEYGDALFSWAFYRTSDKEQAKDLVQDTFLSALNAFNSFEGRSNPKTWLLRILNNKIIDFHRKKASDLTRLDSERNEIANNITESLFDKDNNWNTNGLEGLWQPEETNLMDDPSFQEVLGSCMEDLPTDWHVIISSKYILEKNSKEICQELNITPSNYWQVLHRAKLLLKKCLEKEWFEKI